MPAIGDRVWRTGVSGAGSESRPVFDGFVCQVDDGGMMMTLLREGASPVVLAPRESRAPLEPFSGLEAYGIPTRDAIRIATVFLVREVDGWRWVPRELEATP